MSTTLFSAIRAAWRAPNQKHLAALQTRAVRMGVDLQQVDGRLIAVYEAGRLKFSKRFDSLSEASVWIDALEADHA